MQRKNYSFFATVLAAAALLLSSSCQRAEQVVDVLRVTLYKTSLTMRVGETATLLVTVLPENATDKTVTWSSSDRAVATVDDGLVTAVAEGSATITASAGERFATCTVTIPHVFVPVESISLDQTELTVEVGSTATLTATVLPDNADNPTVTWVSSNESVATVDKGVVTAIAEGNATITARAGDKSATCAVTVPHVYVPVESVELDQTEITVEVGSSATLTATVKPDNADDPDVTWTSSNEAVATVSQTGVVTAVAEGTATITAKAEDKTATCIVTVPHVFVPVESITLDKTEITVEVGSSATLKATVKPDDADNPKVTWTSSNEAVATVDQEGVVTAVAEGSATITAKAEEKTATCTVTVPHVYVPVESVELDQTEITVEVGSSATLTATVKPDNADDPDVTWTSSNEAVATVSQTGVVTAVAEGTATITAKVEDKTATCTVTVPHVFVPVESITLDKTEITVEVGSSATLTATVKPDDADNPKVTWTSSNESVATVSQEGVVTAVAEGSATITARAGDKTATCAVTVPHVYVPVESITLDKTEITVEVGSSATLTATVKPDNADDKTVTWTSSNESVATVSQAGVVTAIAEGTATITAKAGDKTATCAVTVPHVPVPVESITLSESEVYLIIGVTVTITATVKPDNADDPTVTWTTSNASVATVSGGTITATGVGTATITAKAGEKTATCTVTVSSGIVDVDSVTLDRTEITIASGSYVVLVATVLPVNATDKTLTWTSSDKSVATVVDGKVTALAPGTAKITVETNNGKTATCDVTVVPSMGGDTEGYEIGDEIVW